MKQKTSHRTGLVLLGLFILSITKTASAALLEVSFTGSVFLVPAGTESVFNVDDPVSGSFLIESNTPDANSDSDIGLYIGPTDFAYRFGSYQATSAGGTPGDSVSVYNDSTSGDRFQANAINASGADINGYFLTNLTLRLADLTESVFSDDVLPASLDIGDFDIAEARLIFQHEQLPSVNVIANLDSVDISVVPVPAAVWLFGSALLGLLGISKRRKAA